MIMLDRMVDLASVKAILVVPGSLRLAGWVCLTLGRIWRLYRQFGWFWGVAGWLCLIIGRIWPVSDLGVSRKSGGSLGGNA